GAVDLLTYLGIGTNLFSTIVNTPILSYIFDGILLLVPCILLFKPQLIGLAILNFLTWLIYICIYNLYGTHQTHSLLGILILQIPFLFYGKNLFSWWWNA